MTINDELDFLNLKNLYMVNSTKTGKPFMDSERCCYLFESDQEAESMHGMFDNVIVEKPPKLYKIHDFTLLYGMGFKGIKLKKYNRSQELLELSKTKDSGFTNTETNADIIMFRQTSQKKYLRNLKTGKLYAPVLLDVRQPKSYPNIHYCYAVLSNEEIYYVLFTTLQEFQKWKESQDSSNWDLMETNITSFGRIRNNKPILLNPLSDKLILSNKTIKIINE